jgi:hypothetical protein
MSPAYGRTCGRQLCVSPTPAVARVAVEEVSNPLSIGRHRTVVDWSLLLKFLVFLTLGTLLRSQSGFCSSQHEYQHWWFLDQYDRKLKVSFWQWIFFRNFFVSLLSQRHSTCSYSFYYKSLRGIELVRINRRLWGCHAYSRYFKIQN